MGCGLQTHHKDRPEGGGAGLQRSDLVPSVTPGSLRGHTGVHLLRVASALVLYLINHSGKKVVSASQKVNLQQAESYLLLTWLWQRRRIPKSHVITFIINNNNNSTCYLKAPLKHPSTQVQQIKQA